VVLARAVRLGGASRSANAGSYNTYTLRYGGTDWEKL
jgi:hypothetical protein